MALSRQSSLQEKQILITYQGKSGEESTSLVVTALGFGKYFTLDAASGVFKIVKTENTGKETVEMLDQLRNLINYSEVVNKQVELAQRYDRTGFYGFEFVRGINVLGFKVKGLPTLKSTQDLIIPTQVKVNLHG